MSKKVCECEIFDFPMNYLKLYENEITILQHFYYFGALTHQRNKEIAMNTQLKIPNLVCLEEYLTQLILTTNINMGINNTNEFKVAVYEFKDKKNISPLCNTTKELNLTRSTDSNIINQVNDTFSRKSHNEILGKAFVPQFIIGKKIKTTVGQIWNELLQKTRKNKLILENYLKTSVYSFAVLRVGTKVLFHSKI